MPATRSRDRRNAEGRSGMATGTAGVGDTPLGVLFVWKYFSH